jgi:hypothetical protein
MMSEALKAYLRAVAERIIDDEPAEAEDAAWERMTPAERDQANEIVEACFDPWL